MRSVHIIITVLGLLLALGGASAEDAILTPTELYRQSQPSVMTLVVERFDGTKVTGSAFFAIKDGLAVTAWHVVAGARKVTARFATGETAEVPGAIDWSVKRDVALIQVEATGRKMVPIDPAVPEVGARAYVIGAPQGLEFSISDGLISQVRSVEGMKLYQFTCPASPGNSGGPVFSDRGKVLGLVSFQFQEGQNLNFAVPINEVTGLNAATPLRYWWKIGAQMETDPKTKAEVKAAPSRPDPVEADIKGPAARTNTISLPVPKKAPYTFRMPTYHQRDLSTIAVHNGGSKLTRVAVGTEPKKGQFTLNELGVLGFHESVKGRKLKITTSYLPHRIAVYIAHDPSESNLQDALKKRLEMWGDEVVTGAELAAAYERILAEKGSMRDLAKAFGCTHLMVGSTSTEISYYQPYYFANSTVLLTLYDLANGQEVMDRTLDHEGSVGFLAGWRGLREDVVRGCTYAMIDAMVTGK